MLLLLESNIIPS